MQCGMRERSRVRKSQAVRNDVGLYLSAWILLSLMQCGSREDVRGIDRSSCGRRATYIHISEADFETQVARFPMLHVLTY